jgi:hyperosmotically inducible periplasmic protein
MNVRLVAVGAACALVFLGCREPIDQGAPGQETVTDTRQETAPPEPRDADNTGLNVRDRTEAAVTPGDQSGAEADLELVRQVRQAIALNEQFSVLAENITIVAANGQVTLRGPVRTEAERDQIVEMVRGHPGVTTVDNQLQVTRDQE